MALTSIVVSNDGPRIIVNDLVGNPLWIPTKLKELMLNQFISETLLRNGGANNNGLVAYRQDNPSFLIGDIQDIAEGGEIPVSAGQRGTPIVAQTSKRGLGVRVTREMITRNDLNAVQMQMTQLANTFIRADDRVIRTLLQSNLVPTLPAIAAWNTTNGDPRLDLALGVQEITQAAPDIAAGGSTDEWYGFVPDTMVVNGGLLPTLLANDNFNKLYQGNISNENIAYTGKFPGQIYGMDILRSYAFPADRILLCQRGVMGFYSDEWPREITGLYPEGGGPHGGPTQSYRCDATHLRATGLDQPKAALWITGLIQ